jgi:pimeloyl-ACP methyl ester carboxylesterase
VHPPGSAARSADIVVPVPDRRRRPVLVLPGFGASDNSTVALRTYIAGVGHPVHRWRQGRNDGPTPEIVDGLTARFRQLAERHDQPIALVGWSLGGVYAWALARRSPDLVSQVITLGSPLQGTAVSAGPLPMPTSSIWSRRDGIVPWQRSVIEEGPRAENIEVRSTHFTLGFDPLVLVAITDRLGQPDPGWRPFRPPRWLPGAFPVRGQPSAAG